VHLLQRDHSARVVFLAPTVALAEQQAGFFLAAPSFSNGTFRVTCRAGDSTLPPEHWSRVLKEHHVLVMTPQAFLNVLNSGYAHMDDLALLVVDECHHAQADHPTAHILRAWHKSSQRTQILGLTASPAAKALLAATYEALAKLAANLGAQYLVLDETDPEVQAVVPEVAQQEIVVELAQQDAACAACLGGFVVAAVQQLRPLLPDSLPDLPGGCRSSGCRRRRSQQQRRYSLCRPARCHRLTAGTAG
jgi:ERCC4-related helicase